MVGGDIGSFSDFDVRDNDWMSGIPSPCVKSALANGPENFGFGMSAFDSD